MNNIIIPDEVTPGIRKESLWAIIVILLLVVIAETAYIFNIGKFLNNPNTEAQQLDQNSVVGANSLGVDETSDIERLVSQPPQQFPTLTQNRVDGQPNNPQGQKITLNKSYTFSLQGAGGVDQSNFQFNVKSYEFTNNVVVNNFYHAIVDESKKILAVNIEINNDTDKAFKIIARDYVRLSVDQGNWTAPDIHSDPVELRPRSSKSTIIGFPLNKMDNVLRIQIGEIDGEKEIIDIKGI